MPYSVSHNLVSMIGGLGLGGLLGFFWGWRRTRSRSVPVSDVRDLRRQVEVFRAALSEKADILYAERDLSSKLLTERDAALGRLAESRDVREAQRARLDAALQRVAELDKERSDRERKLDRAVTEAWRLNEERMKLAERLEQANRSLEAATAAVQRLNAQLEEAAAREVTAPAQSEASSLEHAGPQTQPEIDAVSVRGDAIRFQLWFPGADAVSVAGDFNHWVAGANPLSVRGDGWWSGEVPDARGGQQYRFRVECGGQVAYHADPYGVEFSADGGTSILPQPMAAPSGFDPPPLSDLVLYQLDIGGFPGASGAAAAISGVIDRLPLLRDLGINGISLLPSRAPGWGYRSGRPFETGIGAGGAGAVRQLVDTAHALGIAVVLDVEYHHIADEAPNSLRSFGAGPNRPGGIYCHEDERGETRWGAHTRPDFRLPEVRRYFIANALYWLRDIGFDGLRLDNTGLLQWMDPAAERHWPEGREFLAALGRAVRAETDGRWLFAEDRLDSDGRVNEHALSQPREEAGLAFDVHWDTGFARLVRAAVSPAAADPVDLAAEAITHSPGGDAAARVLYSESHVEAALPGARTPALAVPEGKETHEARKKSTLAALLAFTSPGIPMLLQGQELFEIAPYAPGSPLDWQRRERFGGVWLLYRDLIHLRRNLAGNTAGLTGEHVRVSHRDSETGVIAWHRWRDGGAGDDVIVVANFSATPKPAYSLGVPQRGVWRVRFNSDSSFYAAENRDFPAPESPAVADPLDGMPYRITVGVDAWSGLILSL